MKILGTDNYDVYSINLAYTFETWHTPEHLPEI